MPKKSAQQMRLFALKTERKRKRRNRSGPFAKTAHTTPPEASGQPHAEPVQLDLIAAIDKLNRPG